MKVPGGTKFAKKCRARGFPDDLWLIRIGAKNARVAPVSDREVESFLIEAAKIQNTWAWPNGGKTSIDLYDLPF
jgi:hypothetical protein